VQAAFALADRGVRDLAGAWALLSSAPAAIMGLADRGSLDHGKRADIVAVDPVARRVEMTIARGCLTHLGPALAERLQKRAPDLAIAAE
jgi:alpha-D-ribose 1-methylphosphonate 5-triphosphate diphosphatase